MLQPFNLLHSTLFQPIFIELKTHLSFHQQTKVGEIKERMGAGFLFYFILQLPWLIRPATSLEAGDSGCSETCGTVSIPQPFGIKRGCYAYNNSWFRVTCNETADGPIPFITCINLDLLGKFWPDDKLGTVNNPVTYLNCGDKGNNSTIKLRR